MSDEKRKTTSRREFLGTMLATGLATGIVGGLGLGCDRRAVVLAEEARTAEPTREGTTMDETIIRRVFLRVRELERQVRFYEEVVGLRVLRRAEGEAALGIEEDGESLLVLSESRSAPARARDEAGLFHIAFRVPTTAALADALRRVRSRHRLDGASDHEISQALYLSDLEGNGLEIYCDSPREQWPMDENGRLGLATRRLDMQALRAEEPTATPERFPSGTDVGHIHLEGTQVNGARSFYADLLGLNITVEMPTVLFTARGGYHHHVGLNSWNRRSQPKREESLGLVAVETVLPEQAPDVLLNRAAELGIAARATEGGVFLKDGDGIEWICRTV